MEFTEMETCYIECDCHTELIQLTWEEPEIVGDEIIDFIYLSFYEYGCRRNNKFTWKERLKHIWYILRTGTPWRDQLVLRTPERLKLMECLNKIELKRRIKIEKHKGEKL